MEELILELGIKILEHPMVQKLHDVSKFRRKKLELQVLRIIRNMKS